MKTKTKITRRVMLCRIAEIQEKEGVDKAIEIRDQITDIERIELRKIQKKYPYMDTKQQDRRVEEAVEEKYRRILYYE